MAHDTGHAEFFQARLDHGVEVGVGTERGRRIIAAEAVLLESGDCGGEFGLVLGGSDGGYGTHSHGRVIALGHRRFGHRRSGLPALGCIPRRYGGFLTGLRRSEAACDNCRIGARVGFLRIGRRRGGLCQRTLRVAESLCPCGRGHTARDQ